MLFYPFFVKKILFINKFNMFLHFCLVLSFKVKLNIEFYNIHGLIARKKMASYS